MRITAATYVCIGIFIFVLAFLTQMLIIARYAPTPTVDDFNHPLEVTGAYRYYRNPRGADATWVNDTPLICAAGSMGDHSCSGRFGPLPKGTPITAEIVNLKTLSGDVALAMNIKLGGKELFSQTPVECISAWRNINLYWFSGYALMLSSFVVLITRIIFQAFCSTGDGRSSSRQSKGQKKTC